MIKLSDFEHTSLAWRTYTLFQCQNKWEPDPLASCTHSLYYIRMSDICFNFQVIDLQGENQTVVIGSDLRSNQLYVTYYIFWSKFILVEAIPYFTILILNSLIIGKIYKSNQFRKRFVVSTGLVSPAVWTTCGFPSILGVLTWHCRCQKNVQ